MKGADQPAGERLANPRDQEDDDDARRANRRQARFVV
jgi:hypothetical protein